jgi:cysteine desulfurase/selenocysteine lyase
MAELKSFGQLPRPFDVARIREDFPILKEKIRGKDLVYLDNAATSQKPLSVIEAESRYYRTENSNIHRGVHRLSEQATADYEAAREKIRAFIGAAETSEVILVRGATEGINLVAATYGLKQLREGDEILISAMEHHSNIVPWQLLCGATGAKLKVIPMSDAGELQMAEFEKLLGPKTKILAITHVSNALGTINPIESMIARAHAAGAVVLVDGAQAAPHLSIDVTGLDCDFYVLSAHKIYGPTGVGVLYGKKKLLEAMPPYQGGGDMIASVSFEKTTYNVLPYKFEAGTPNIAGVIAFGAAIDYLSAIGLKQVSAYEDELLAYGTEKLSTIAGVRLIGTAKKKASVLSFVIEGIHPHDIGTILDQDGIAVRTGHHCAQPVMDRFGIPATARASLAFYNTRAELDALARGILRVKEIFG